MKFTKAEYKEFYALLQSLQSEKEWEQVSEDLFTPGEMQIFLERWNVAKELLKGKKSQRAIQKDVGCALATVSRANKALQYGSGGFKLLWKRFGELFS